MDQNAEYYHPMEAPPPPVGEPAAADPWGKYLAAIKLQQKFMVKEGVAVVLRDAGKPQALLNMTDGTVEAFQQGALPSAFITGEGYRMIFRMLKKGPWSWKLKSRTN